MKWSSDNNLGVLLAFRNTFMQPHAKKAMKFILAVFISAFLVVFVKNRYRATFIEYQGLQNQQEQLHIEWMKMLIEESTWGNYARVEKIASENIGMVVPPAQNIQILVLPGDTTVSTVDDFSESDTIYSGS